MSAATSDKRGGPFTFAELARRAQMPTKTMRRWLLRAADNQPEVGGVVRLPQGGYLVPSMERLREYKGYEDFQKKFLSTEDNEALQARIRDQDRQIQALRARVGAAERLARAQGRRIEQVVSLLERAGGRKIPEEDPVVEVSEPLERSSRARSA